MFLKKSFVIALVTLVLAANGHTQTLVMGLGAQVTAKEIQEEMAQQPVSARQSLAAVESMHNNVSNIFVRRVLAKEALQKNMDKNPLVAAAIEKAKERILSDAMLEAIDQANQPSLQAIEDYAKTTYKVNSKRFITDEQVKIRHILIKTQEPDAKAKTETILKELQSGADFAQLAKEKSQDPGSASKGGDLGWLSKGRTVKPFEDAALALEKSGQLSPVIQTQFGFHVIKLEEKRPAGVQPFEEVKDNLMREAQGTILNNGRIKEQDRILKDAKYDTTAIEALAKEFAKP
jgi:peptidyl-prolyl cis-trans isomerase C